MKVAKNMEQQAAEQALPYRSKVTSEPENLSS